MSTIWHIMFYCAGLKKHTHTYTQYAPNIVDVQKHEVRTKNYSITYSGSYIATLQKLIRKTTIFRLMASILNILVCRAWKIIQQFLKKCC